ncbi:hypothetical protein FK85_07360 [Halorubrum saccharovorum]|uniref:Uncharacterized protein n=1 Tax=Halorubrum saccharovorum TaxID=2248 RepID=A0A081EXG5_9EURY|nr:hypothetical protein [Halorubrum saccharovorum]KDS92103.1 hypothetical protein FK85_07360 [Halorubrum saccharovorum]
MAVYAALFLLVAGVAGVLTATAESPEIAFENPDFEVSEGDSIEVNGEMYTVAGISEEDSTVIGTLEQEETAELSETWSNESTVTVDDREWTVEITGDDPSEFTLVEVLDRQAILEADDDADNETVERDDGEYVVVTEDGESTLVPVSEYFPAPEEQSYATGDSFEYDGQSVTVDEVTTGQAVVVWEGTQTNTIEIEQDTRVTIGETEFIAHFPDASTMTLSTDLEGYEAQVAEIDQFEQYNSGLTRVLILSLFSVVLLLSTTFIPSRY